MGERYTRVRSLGGSAPTDTWLARDEERGLDVVLKELRVSRVDQWKTIELFEREAKILRQLEHPCIPAYLDAFHTEDGEDIVFGLVQEFVEGPTLHDLLAEEEGLPVFDEHEARAFAAHMLELLEHLHALNPPVTHRDIKPGNIIQARDGRWVLVDFGAVQARLPRTMTGSTFVGTTGYMPPEQLMGRAVPTSDLFALGATLIHASTGFHPGDLPVRRMRMEFESLIEFDDDFEAWMARLVAPTPAQRWSSARAARRALEELPTARSSALVHVTSDAPTSSRITRDGDRQIVTFKRAWRQPLAIFGAIGVMLFVVTLIAASLGKLSLLEMIPFALAFIASIPMLLYSIERHTLTLSPDSFLFERTGLLGGTRARLEGHRRHLQLEKVFVKLRNAHINASQSHGILLRHGVEELVIGANHKPGELDAILHDLGYAAEEEEL